MLLVGGIVAIQALGRAWVLSGRTFYWDDFIIVGSAADADWWTTDYFLQPHDGHLAPLAFMLQAVANQIAPWQWWLPAVLMLLGQLAVTVSSPRAALHRGPFVAGAGGTGAGGVDATDAAGIHVVVGRRQRPAHAARAGGITALAIG